MQNLREWYNARSNQTKAALRTFAQTVVGVILLSLVQMLGVTQKLFDDDPTTVADWGDLVDIGSYLMFVIIGAVIGLVSYAHNRWFSNPAHYGTE